VAGDLGTYSADASGLITKGLGIGMDIRVLIGLDLAAPENALILGCNVGSICTDLDPDSPTYNDPFTSVKRCLAGPNQGMSCVHKDDCGGEKCSNKHTQLCLRGPSDGQPCSDDVDCPDGKCKFTDPSIDPIEVLKVVTAGTSQVLISSGDPNDPDYSPIP